MAQQKQDAHTQWVEDRKATTRIKVYDDVLWELMDVSDESRGDGATTSG